MEYSSQFVNVFEPAENAGRISVLGVCICLGESDDGPRFACCGLVPHLVDIAMSLFVQTPESHPFSVHTAMEVFEMKKYWLPVLWLPKMVWDAVRG